jgi:hypothetical protein
MRINQPLAGPSSPNGRTGEADCWTAGAESTWAELHAILDDIVGGRPSGRGGDKPRGAALVQERGWGVRHLLFRQRFMWSARWLGYWRTVTSSTAAWRSDTQARVAPPPMVHMESRWQLQQVLLNLVMKCLRRR